MYIISHLKGFLSRALTNNCLPYDLSAEYAALFFSPIIVGEE